MYRLYVDITFHRRDFNVHIVQSAGAVEYTDYTSVEAYPPKKDECPDMTLNNLMLKFQ